MYLWFIDNLRGWVQGIRLFVWLLDRLSRIFEMIVAGVVVLVWGKVLRWGGVVVGIMMFGVLVGHGVPVVGDRVI